MGISSPRSAQRPLVNVATRSSLYFLQNIYVVRPGPHWWVKIGGLGTVPSQDQDRLITRNHVYLAPEVQFESIRPVRKAPTDIWALGVTVFFLLTMKTPFPRASDLFVYTKSKSGYPLRPQLQEFGITSDDLISFIEGVLNPDPSARLLAQEARSSPWL